MSYEQVGSLTLWERLYTQPDEGELWKEFVRRYKDLVLGWTRKWLHDANDGEDMFAEFCKKVHKHLNSADRKRFEPRNDSYRQILREIVRNVCMDYLSRAGRHTTHLVLDGTTVEPAQWGRRAEADFIDGLDGLIEQEREQEEAIDQLAIFRDRFRDALVLRKAQPQYDPRTTEIFFKKYHDLVPIEQLDCEYGFKSRDSSGQYARRERNRLIKLMGLPTETVREVKLAEAIITGLARIYGDVSTTVE